MNDKFSVYWRSKDGLGTHVWKTGLTEAEANAETVWCEGANPDATLVWATAYGANQAHLLTVKGQPS